MRGALPTAPLRAEFMRKIAGNYTIQHFVNEWVVRFSDADPRAIYRFVERVFTAASLTITRDRADEAALVLGLMPTDIWGEAWWD